MVNRTQPSVRCAFGNVLKLCFWVGSKLGEGEHGYCCQKINLGTSRVIAFLCFRKNGYNLVKTSQKKSNENQTYQVKERQQEK